MPTTASGLVGCSGYRFFTQRSVSSCITAASTVACTPDHRQTADVIKELPEESFSALLVGNHVWLGGFSKISVYHAEQLERLAEIPIPVPEGERVGAVQSMALVHKQVWVAVERSIFVISAEVFWASSSSFFYLFFSFPTTGCLSNHRWVLI
jgi:hypothetical protein